MPFRCPHFEFEDVIAEVDAADFLAPRFTPNNSRHALTKKLAYHTPIILNPGVENLRVKDNYDIFLAICGNPTDLHLIHALSDWRSRCRKAVCLIDELWVRQIGAYRNYLKLLKDFDLVILYYSQTAETLSKTLGTSCIFLPPGVDAIRFCPYPNPPERMVDVYSIGRRSAITHRALLDMAAEDNCFYLHDSIAANQVVDAKEHRMLFANTLKRSRYFIVNPGLIDAPQVRGDQIEIGNRYFEGAAAGSVMVGERPRNGQFEQLFDWPDAVVEATYGSSDIARVLRSLDREPDRLEDMRRVNVTNALRRHDWCFRWQAILQELRMEPLPALAERKRRLLDAAEAVSGQQDPGVGKRKLSGSRVAAIPVL
jgi:hypothetical protein